MNPNAKSPGIESRFDQRLWHRRGRLRASFRADAFAGASGRAARSGCAVGPGRDCVLVNNGLILLSKIDEHDLLTEPSFLLCSQV